MATAAAPNDCMSGAPSKFTTTGRPLHDASAGPERKPAQSNSAQSETAQDQRRARRAPNVFLLIVVNAHHARKKTPHAVILGLAGCSSSLLAC